MSKRTRSRRAGGIMDSFSQWGTSLSTGATDLWNKTKQSASTGYGSLTGSAPTTPDVTSSYISPTSTQGGRRKRRTKRRMRGGMNAAPISGIHTVQPQVWVGGRRTRRRRKSRRHRR